jgi:hypothetical protein
MRQINTLTAIGLLPKAHLSIKKLHNGSGEVQLSGIYNVIGAPSSHTCVSSR